MRRLTSAPNPSPARALVEIGEILRALAAVAVAHAVEARQIRRALGGRDHVISGHRHRQVRQTHFHGLGAERGEDCERVADELRVARLEAVEELAQQADLQALERRVEERRIVRHRRIDAGRVLRIESRHDLENRGRIRGALCEHPGLIEARGEGDHAVTGYPPVRRLDPGDAGEGGRLPDRAARIGARREGREAGGRGRGRAAGGAAGHLGRVPGISHRTIEAGLVRGPHGEFVHVRLAQHDHPGGLELRDHRGVIGCDEVVEHPRSAAGADPVGAENILMNEGDAEQADRARRRPGAHPRGPRRRAPASAVTVMTAFRPGLSRSMRARK